MAIAAKAIVVVLIALLLHVTSDPFTMVQGSDFTSFVIAPALTVQIVFLMVFAIALAIPTRPAFSVARWAVALCAVLVASHRLVIDNLDHQIRDVYVAVPIQSLDLDAAHEGGLATLADHRGVLDRAGGRRCLAMVLLAAADRP